MTSPTGTYSRLCSSVLAPLVLLALLWPGHPARRTAAEARAGSGVAAADAIPVEHPDVVLPRTKPKPRAKAEVHAPIAPSAPARQTKSVFTGLGAWVDLFDVGVIPLDRTIATLRANGVHTLYLESGESTTPGPVRADVGPWLAAAHHAGIKVVAWYLPHYSNVAWDVHRTVATAHYQFQGERFDGVGVDIEYKGAVRNNAVWNHRVAVHLDLVRRALGPHYPLASIPPPPLQMAVAPASWAGFPWRSLAHSSSEIMLMSYWSFRLGCPQKPVFCAYEFTRSNVLLTRQLTSNRVPIHIIGGVADRISGSALKAFIQGAIDAGADGASIYDVATTKRGWWVALRALSQLGR
jgi:hypothetical protein